MIDGDTIRVGETTVRLFGIDAPEGRQECNAVDGGVWSCGDAAADRLREFATLGPVACEGDEFDDFGRLLALCDAYDGTPINAALVAEGLAWAFRSILHTVRPGGSRGPGCRHRRLAAPTIPPWEYRAALNDEAIANQPQPPGDCLIKGNINRDGEWIYHLPGTPTYDDTVIRVEDAERWFCSEQQAIEAGWRAPRGP